MILSCKCLIYILNFKYSDYSIWSIQNWTKPLTGAACPGRAGTSRWRQIRQLRTSKTCWKYSAIGKTIHGRYLVTSQMPESARLIWVSASRCIRIILLVYRCNSDEYMPDATWYIFVQNRVLCRPNILYNYSGFVQAPNLSKQPSYALRECVTQSYISAQHVKRFYNARRCVLIHKLYVGNRKLVLLSPRLRNIMKKTKSMDGCMLLASQKKVYFSGSKISQ